MRRTRWLPALLALWLVAPVGSLGACSAEAEDSRGSVGAERTAPSRGVVESERRPSAEPAPSDWAARHVILVTVDTLRADSLGFSGEEGVETPVLDALASRGLRFTEARAHAVLTLPSHASILSGRLPHEHGIRANGGFVFPETVDTLATVLSEEGFATGAFVGAFPLDARYGLDRGFDVYDDRYPEGAPNTDFVLVERRGDEVVEAAREWWAAPRSPEERKFLWVHLFDPHTPYDPPAPFATRYAENPYLGEVAATDRFLEPLLGAGLDDTLVVFTSDHGEALGDHGEKTHGLFAYDSTLAVPLVIAGPGIDAGTVDEPVGHVDLLPTILDGLGLEPPAGLPGRSLLSGPPPPRPLVFESLGPNLDRGWAPLHGVVHDGYKAIVLPIPELYDLETDPREQVNLAEKEPERYDRLASLVPEGAMTLPDRSSLTAEERAALESLGYLGDAGSRTPMSYGPEDDPKRLVEVDQAMHRLIERYHTGDLEEAIRIGRRIVSEHPDMGIAAYYLAQTHLEVGNPGQALEVLEDALRRGARYAPLVRQLALLRARSGDPGAGVKLLQAAGDPNDPATLVTLGSVLSDAGDQRRARQVLERVFDLDPRNPSARETLALVALRTESWQEAEKEARAALELNPDLPQALNYLGVALYNLGRPAEGIEAWERAVELAPDDYDLLYNLGVVASQIGDLRRARRALERFVAAAPRDRYAEDIERAKATLSRLGGTR